MITSQIYKSAAGEKEVMALYDAMLQRWPVPRQEIYLPTRYGKTFIIASGPEGAPPLILLHGAASNALSWMGDIPAFSRCSRVYVPDIPGDPGRSEPNRPAWNSPAYAEWLEDVFNGLNIQTAALVGLSQGGWTALKFSTYWPERVSSLVLLTPAGVTQDKFSFLLKAILFSMAGKRGAERINSLTFGKQPIHPDAVKVMNVIMTHFKPRISKLQLFTDAELSRLTMPVLLLGGKLDAIHKVEKIEERLRKRAPYVTAKIYSDKGHVLANLAGDIMPFLTVNK